MNGCEERLKTRKEIELLEKKVFNCQKEIDNFKSDIFTKKEKDAELQKAGYCLKNVKKPVKNELTGQVKKIELMHDKNCITNKGLGTSENIDLIAESEQVLKNKIVYLLEKKLKEAGYKVESFKEFLEKLEACEIVTRHKTAQKEIVKELIDKGGL